MDHYTISELFLLCFSARLFINALWFLFKCTPLGRTSDSMTVPT